MHAYDLNWVSCQRMHVWLMELSIMVTRIGNYIQNLILEVLPHSHPVFISCFYYIPNLILEVSVSVVSLWRLD